MEGSGRPYLRGRLRRLIRTFAEVWSNLRPSPCQPAPTPISVAVRRHAVREGLGLGNRFRPEPFEGDEALDLNRARLEHLATLELPLSGRKVLDVGCGIGHLTPFFLERGCRVVCVDGREANIARLRSRHPDLEAHVADVERDPLTRLGTFEVVFCYGLLYHLENPIAGLRNLASVCGDLLLLETQVTDHPAPLLQVADESSGTDQALRGMGSRPTPSFVVLGLNRVGFEFVYVPREPPRHVDFEINWQGNLDWTRQGHCLRCVFVASRSPIESPHLASVLE